MYVYYIAAFIDSMHIYIYICSIYLHENHNIVEELSIVRILCMCIYIYRCIRVDNICRTLLFLGGGQSTQKPKLDAFTHIRGSVEILSDGLAAVDWHIGQ